MAEAQALEEARRRNPVKLGIWIAGFFVALMGLWIMKKQLEIHSATAELTGEHGLNAQWKADEARYAGLTNDEARIAGIKGKIAALDHLHTNRFLWGSVLNALQQTVVDQVQVDPCLGPRNPIEREASKTIGSGATLKTIPGSANF